MAIAVGETRPDLFAVPYPSPWSLLQYPLFAVNVKMLCEKDGWRSRKQSSLATTIYALRLTYQTEGWGGLYRGVHLHLVHQASRCAFGLLTGRCLRLAKQACTTEGSDSATRIEARPVASISEQEEVQLSRREGMFAWNVQHLWLGLKYAIDLFCYPILLASTRAIILRDDGMTTWQRLRLWCHHEGVSSLFSGATASLLSTACDEVMDAVLGACIDHCAASSELGSTDKLTLKACSSSVASVLTAPLNHVGVIQRCQSCLPGLVWPTPLWGTIRKLPWLSTFYQFLLFGGILAVNFKLIQLKLELDDARVEDDSEE